jgi:enoyl-CoA hydratase/carnithine racemase
MCYKPGRRPKTSDADRSAEGSVTMTTAETVLVDVEGGVATVTLNRPDRLNALTPEMQVRYADVLRELDADREVRVIVVTGAGRGFCSGADLSALADAQRLRTLVPEPRLLPTSALEVRKPLVAAVNGPVAGIGFAVMLSCDVRFVAAGASITTSFARLGLVAEYGLSWLLPRVVGTGRALEILLSGRTLSAAETERLGLAHEVVADRPVLERALDWAREVAASCSPRSLAVIKRQVYGDLDRGWGDALDRALGLMVESFGWTGLPEALAARAEGRPPAFAPLGDGE